MEQAFEKRDLVGSTTGVAPLEVEQKYRMDSHEPLLRWLREQGASELPFEEQCDIYLQHPNRDFAVSGEAFRIRQVNERALVTYKGPRLAGPIKIRTELEVPLAVQTDQSWMQILEKLGFRVIAKIAKRRRSFSVEHDSESLTIALDEVERLGKFVEIEAIVPDHSKLAGIQEKILSMARQLDLVNIESRSYLRMFLENPRP